MSKFQHQIAVGPEFFQKARHDYAQFEWALAREFMQNSMDCGSKQIDVTVELSADSRSTIVTVRNDGEPMTRDILVNKLLSLGSSGKDFASGAVGGFGKAKEILYFCHESYTIRSGACIVTGRGAGYDLTISSRPFHGTESVIVLPGNQESTLTKGFQQFCKYAQWDGVVTINGEQVTCNLKKGSMRRDLTWGTIYTNNSVACSVVVRVNGIPMFWTFTGYEGCVVVELKGESSKTLTSNRDGLRYGVREQYETFLNELTTDKRKALKVDRPSYLHYAGRRYSTNKPSTLEPGAVVAMLKQLNIRAVVNAPSANNLDPDSQIASGGESTIMEEFIVKNETELAVPNYYQPDQAEFGSYSLKLARVWGNLMLEMHKMLGLSAEFAIGFVISADAVAQHEKTTRFGTVYYINPVEVVTQESGSKSLRKRWKLTDRGMLIAAAAHEVVHGMGFSFHDETYAAKYTQVMAQVLDERKRFNPCFTD